MRSCGAARLRIRALEMELAVHRRAAELKESVRPKALRGGRRDRGRGNAGLIREVHTASYGSFGANRVHAELTPGRGVVVGHNAVAMLMQRAGIAGRNGAREWRGVPGAATAEDLVDRIFRRERPNGAVADRHHRAPNAGRQGVLRRRPRRVSRRVVGWSISHNPTAALTCNALGMAIEHRDAIRGTVIHSDHGLVTAWTFSERARKSGLLPSMGTVGDCYDCEQNRGRCSLSV